MNAVASPHPAPSRFSATCHAALKALDRAIDLTLQIGLRLSGLALAVWTAMGGARLLGHLERDRIWPIYLDSRLAAECMACALCFVCAILFLQFSWRTVPEIRHTGGMHWFSHWTILALAQSALLVSFIVCAFSVAMSTASALMQLAAHSVFRVDTYITFLGGSNESNLVAELLALPVAILASRYTWKLERRWFPARVSHPLFGRWLEWKGRA